MKYISEGKGFTIVEIMIVIAVIGIIAALAVPYYMTSRDKAWKMVCIANLKHIYDAKSIWALTEGKTSESVPVWDDLVPEYLQSQPSCGAGGIYDIKQVDEYPTCTVEGHQLQ